MFYLEASIKFVGDAFKYQKVEDIPAIVNKKGEVGRHGGFGSSFRLINFKKINC